MWSNGNITCIMLCRIKPIVIVTGKTISISFSVYYFPWEEMLNETIQESVSYKNSEASANFILSLLKLKIQTDIQLKYSLKMYILPNHFFSLFQLWIQQGRVSIPVGFFLLSGALLERFLFTSCPADVLADRE